MQQCFMTALCVNFCGLVKLKVSVQKQQHNILPLEVYCSPNADPWCLLYLEPYFSEVHIHSSVLPWLTVNLEREKIFSIPYPSLQSPTPTNISSQAAIMTPRTNFLICWFACHNTVDTTIECERVSVVGTQFLSLRANDQCPMTYTYSSNRGYNII